MLQVTSYRLQVTSYRLQVTVSGWFQVLGSMVQEVKATPAQKGSSFAEWYGTTPASSVPFCAKRVGI